MPRVRALVLAAGHGTRLRPLTLYAPKPLLPVVGEPIVGHTLRALSTFGCEAALLNLHHLPHMLPAHLGKSWYGMPIDYSWEEEIQGTLGALYPTRDFLAGADAALLINGDSLCPWPLRALVRRHVRTGADVTLLVLARGPDAGLGGGIGVDRGGRVVQMRDMEAAGEVVSRHVFAGVHVLSPRILNRVEEGPGDIIGDFYQPLLQEGAVIQTLPTRRRWHDLGTPTRYLDACLDQARGGWFRRRPAVSPLARIDPGASAVGSVIEIGAEVADGASIRDSVILEGARIGAGSRIQRCIVGPEVQLPGSSEVEGRMINRYDKRHRVGETESIMGDLVYTPL